MVYFVLALWLFRDRNRGYGLVMAKLADGSYHQRRGADLLAGHLDQDGWVDAGDGRRWRQPNVSSLSRGRGKLGEAPVRMLFEQVAGPTGADGAPGVFCCGLRVVSMDGSVTDVPDSEENDAFFGRPSNQSRDGAFPQVRWVPAAESGTGSLLEHALATFLLKILMPGFYVRDRPDRASPRKTKKAGDFPPASPASPASPTSPAESSSTCSIPGRSPKRQGH